MAEAGDRETTAECRLLGLQCHNRRVVTLSPIARSDEHAKAVGNANAFPSGGEEMSVKPFRFCNGQPSDDLRRMEARTKGLQHLH